MMSWSNHGYGMWGNWGLGGTIMMIFFWAIIIIGAILIFRFFTAGSGNISATQGGGPVAGEQDPLELLRGRYAKGEIDTREFEERKRILEDNG